MDLNNDFNPYSESEADTNAFSEEAGFLAPSEEDTALCVIIRKLRKLEDFNLLIFNNIIKLSILILLIISNLNLLEKELSITYYNKASPIMNRDKIKDKDFNLIYKLIDNNIFSITRDNAANNNTSFNSSNELTTIRRRNS
ncbi:hypothetical protein EDB81DRAFT_767968 [Dactylonectria macrodidyma]|uniref:Uncharacterized protein n=1 Tax=Dactylonectria macrodidyma TaxID=307937 RepID=A0A9P9IBD9_9HYPO|nr:hypothetical protein EDB81DRAFT_767968 [Dactylonectria macrodidyma]